MAWTHWWRLQDGPAGAVLAVDFALTRAGASFADLGAQLPGSVGLYQAIPPVPGGPDVAEASEPSWYLGPWLADLAAHRPAVPAVLGYCAGVAMAAALASGVQRLGLGAPALVLIEPQLVTADTVVAELARAVSGLADGLSDQESAAGQAGVRAAASADVPLAELAPLARASYDALARACAQRLGLTDQLAKELCTRFAGYLAYLVACSRLGLTSSRLGPWVETCTVVASAGHVVPIPAGRIVRVAGAPHTLLGSADVAEVVAGLAHPVAPPPVPPIEVVQARGGQ